MHSEDDIVATTTPHPRDTRPGLEKPARRATRPFSRALTALAGFTLLALASCGSSDEPVGTPDPAPEPEAAVSWVADIDIELGSGLQAAVPTGWKVTGQLAEPQRYGGGTECSYSPGQLSNGDDVLYVYLVHETCDFENPPELVNGEPPIFVRPANVTAAEDVVEHQVAAGTATELRYRQTLCTNECYSEHTPAVILQLTKPTDPTMPTLVITGSAPQHMLALAGAITTMG